MFSAVCDARAVTDTAGLRRTSLMSTVVSAAESEVACSVIRVDAVCESQRSDVKSFRHVQVALRTHPLAVKHLSKVPSAVIMKNHDDHIVLRELVRTLQQTRHGGAR